MNIKVLQYTAPALGLIAWRQQPVRDFFPFFNTIELIDEVGVIKLKHSVQ